MDIFLNDDTLRFIATHRTDNVSALALHMNKYPDVNAAAALQQIAGWQIARRKLPAWSRCDGLLYPPHLSLEQCSSEATALYKVEVTTGWSQDDYWRQTNAGKRLDATLTDLTGGFGVDCAYLGNAFERATYVERQANLCALARHNFPLLGALHIEVCHADATTYLEQMGPVDWLFLDPARRDKHGGKKIAINECTPDVTAMRGLLLTKATRTLIKLSSMLDISLALKALPETTDIHIVAVDNDCKELLFVLSREASGRPTFHCVNLTAHGRQTFSFTSEEEAAADCQTTSRVGAYLYEPNVTLLKAGVFRMPASRYSLSKLHSNSHLYTSDTLQPDFPGRTFRVLKTVGFGKQDMKTLHAQVAQANLTVRNFPLSVADLRRKLKLREGGETYLFATTLADGRKVLICTKKITMSGS